MKNKLIGGILLIVGTAIGGGMLALPIATAQLGFINSSILLFLGWVVMTFSAFLILEVNLWLPSGSHMISMARATLGRSGQVVAWIVYLLLLYSLLSAYMAGGGDFLHNLLLKVGLPTPEFLDTFLFAGLLGFIVYRGIHSVDYINRGLMFSKFAIFLILVVVILAFITPNFLLGGQLQYVTTAVTVMITSFGFATIVPSLRVYFNEDVAKLRRALFIGSLIPLICYIVWDLAIMGAIPRTGDQSLLTVLNSGHSASELVNTLSNRLDMKIVTALARIFTTICLATSYLGVGLCLADFLADGFGIVKVGKGKLIVAFGTFVPPLIIVLINPNIFIAALSYAGIYTVILLVLLPILMAWYGRYYKNHKGSFTVPGGKLLLIVLFITGIAITVQGVREVI